MNIMNHILYGTYSPIPTNSDYVDIFTFIFCFEYFPCIIPYPIDIVPPVCHLILLCTSYSAYIHMYRSESVFAPIVILYFILFFTYLRLLFNFSQLSTLLFVTLVVRKDTNISISGSPRFTICKSFAVTLWKFIFCSCLIVRHPRSHRKYDATLVKSLLFQVLLQKPH